MSYGQNTRPKYRGEGENILLMGIPWEPADGSPWNFGSLFSTLGGIYDQLLGSGTQLVVSRIKSAVYSHFSHLGGFSSISWLSPFVPLPVDDVYSFRILSGDVCEHIWALWKPKTRFDGRRGGAHTQNDNNFAPRRSIVLIFLCLVKHAWGIIYTPTWTWQLALVSINKHQLIITFVALWLNYGVSCQLT